MIKLETISCIVNWELHLKTLKPIDIKKDYDFKKYSKEEMKRKRSEFIDRILTRVSNQRSFISQINNIINANR